VRTRIRAGDELGSCSSAVKPLRASSNAIAMKRVFELGELATDAE
jgi:hypothetical protein